MGISNYPNGFSDGVVIRGVPVDIPHPGKVFYVNNTSVLPVNGVKGGNSNDGSYLRPFSTIDYAIGKCVANRGDVIYVMPGHSETVAAAAGIDLDVAGVKLIGLGRGSKQARIDFTATGSTVEVNADDVSIVNMNFHANVSAVAIGLSILTLATNCLVKDCVFDVETTATDEFLISINAGVGCDGLIVENCVIDMGLGGAATGIKLVGATAGADIKGCRIVGDYSLACIAGLTTLSTEVYIEDNLLINGGSGNVGAVAAISMVAGTTGCVRRNHILSDVATHVLMTVADTMVFFENYSSDDVGAATAGIIRHGATSVTASADA